MTYSKGFGPDGVTTPNSSGIKVIIVGPGLGGLALAIECARKGHTVPAFEQHKELKPIGDSLGVPSNAARVVRRGELLVSSNMDGYSYPDGYLAHRGELAMEFFKHAKELGVQFHFGERVTSYWEDEEEAGILVNGTKFSADCVFGADGVHSKARNAMTRSDLSPVSSSYAMYRAWFNADEIRADPETKWVLEGTELYDKFLVYLGKDVHVMLGTGKNGKEAFWMCTHKDSYEIEESWSFPGNVGDMLKVIEDWLFKDKIEKTARKTPPCHLIDFKLLWIDALPTWVSPGSRMMLIGDAAHPFLPRSGQGAAQAIEDAATLAITLELGGQSGVQTSLRVAEAIRYKRAGLMQKMGLETRDMWHNTDWAEVAKDTSLITLPRPNWIFGHDCQAYAY